jgi:hemerythrin superfamily protein
MTLRGTVRKASKDIKTAIVGEQSSADTDILDTLKEEHEEVKDLLAQLQDAEGAAERRALVKQIKEALVPHTKAEEKIVYDAVIALRDKDAQKDGYEGYLEHEWASKTLDRLAAANPTSPEHKAAAKVLKELVEHHIEEEESNVWDDVKENFSDDDRIAMNRKFLAAKTKVRVP